MIYRTIMDVYCGKITKRANKMCGQSTEMSNFIACGDDTRTDHHTC